MKTYTFDFTVFTDGIEREFRFDALFANYEDAAQVFDLLAVLPPAGTVSGGVYEKNPQLDIEALFGLNPANLTETEAEILAEAEKSLNIPANPYED